MREFEVISKEMKRLEEQGKWDERNKLVPVWTDLYHSHDFGFKVGQEVEYYPYSSGKPVIGKILDIQKDNQIVFAGTTITALLVKKINHDEQETLGCEQLKLF